MTNRVKRVKVSFAGPFQLAGMAKAFPPGDYEITTEEEPLGDVMYPAYRRISTQIYLPRPAGQIGLGEILDIDPDELDRELDRAKS